MCCDESPKWETQINYTDSQYYALIIHFVCLSEAGNGSVRQLQDVQCLLPGEQKKYFLCTSFSRQSVRQNRMYVARKSRRSTLWMNAAAKVHFLGPHTKFFLPIALNRPKAKTSNFFISPLLASKAGWLAGLLRGQQPRGLVWSVWKFLQLSLWRMSAIRPERPILPSFVRSFTCHF